MLSVRGLEQYYGGSHTLRSIDLEVPAGTCTALMGRNGVGKTTLLRCLVGELPVRSGSVQLGGEDVTVLPSYERARRGMGYVPQGREIFSRLTVSENLTVGESAAGGGATMDRTELEELFRSLAGKHSLVVVEHDMHFVDSIASKVTVLHEGRVLAQGSMDAIREDPRVIDVYLGR